ncbi:hypothetical protein O181_084569 [Austropuccinia psidii MF-1]|uniref:Uncharacterized protein n=1 Tax=Austropuccinia psidii MF-1 TaxID=1389203 RepID=A0A9Q3IMN1_9BASI|nr:hypothetical protein [Austropuccinia psidii MF-1]
MSCVASQYSGSLNTHCWISQHHAVATEDNDMSEKGESITEAVKKQGPSTHQKNTLWDPRRGSVHVYVRDEKAEGSEHEKFIVQKLPNQVSSYFEELACGPGVAFAVRVEYPYEFELLPFKVDSWCVNMACRTWRAELIKVGLKIACRTKTARPALPKAMTVQDDADSRPIRIEGSPRVSMRLMSAYAIHTTFGTVTRDNHSSITQANPKSPSFKDCGSSNPIQEYKKTSPGTSFPKRAHNLYL